METIVSRKWMEVLKGASCIQLLKMRRLIQGLDQTAYGYMIFYSEDALEHFDKGDYEHPDVLMAIHLLEDQLLKIF